MWKETGVAVPVERRPKVWAGVLVVLLVSCSGSSGDDSPRLPESGIVGSFDFVGNVAEVEFGADWQMTPSDVALSTGGGDVMITVGPQTMILSDGTRLDVPKGTPGGNWCYVLVHPSKVHDITGESSATVDDLSGYEASLNPTSPCVVAGQTTVDGAVSWYHVLSVEQYDGAEFADVGRVVEPAVAGSELTTDRGYQITSNVEEASCGIAASEATGTRALMDWTTGEVVELICLEV